MTRAQEEHLITRLASRQHGLVTRAQLLAAGMSARVVDRRVAATRLRLVQRGVYEVGPLRSQWAREMAAVLACGGGTDSASVVGTVHVSHLTAGNMLGLIEGGSGPPTHVTVIGAQCGRRPRIVVHRVAVLAPHEVTMRHGVPITAPVRTLVDLASMLASRELERAVTRAEKLHLVGGSELVSQIDAYRKHRGIALLRRILRHASGPKLTRSEAEERLLSLIGRSELPRPLTNRRVANREVDLLWPRQRLVVEVDGFVYHSTRSSFENDRRRDAELLAMGYRVLRFTWRQIVHEQETVLVRLARTLTMYSTDPGIAHPMALP